MGTNKRYAEHFDRLGMQRMYDRAMVEGKPQSLSSAEIDLEREPVTFPPRPIPVTAWVRYPAMPVRARAWVIKWTERATALAWSTPDAGVHGAWVWSNAVTGRVAEAGEQPPEIVNDERRPGNLPK